MELGIKKIFTSSDATEIFQAIEEDTYRKLIELSNKYESYQAAIDETQVWLKEIIKAMPAQRDLIIRSAEKAGQRFLVTIGEAQRKHFDPVSFHKNEGIMSGVRFGNITIKQGPKK